MANLFKTRKRVFALPRASDGSAFQKCESCGASVAIALYDMHDCKRKPKIKRFKGNVEKGMSEFKLEKSSQESVKSEVLNQPTQVPSFYNQPRSAFLFFMEGFRESHKNENHIDVDTRGFEIWKNMSIKEREKFVNEAGRVNKAYEKTLLKEVDDTKEARAAAAISHGPCALHTSYNMRNLRLMMRQILRWLGKLMWYTSIGMTLTALEAYNTSTPMNGRGHPNLEIFGSFTGKETGYL